jgi:hypothetical protein
MRYKRGDMQDALVNDIHEAINKNRVDVGDHLTYIEVYGCLEVVRRDLQKEADAIKND